MSREEIGKAVLSAGQGDFLIKKLENGDMSLCVNDSNVGRFYSIKADPQKPGRSFLHKLFILFNLVFAGGSLLGNRIRRCALLWLYFIKLLSRIRYLDSKYIMKDLILFFRLVNF